MEDSGVTSFSSSGSVDISLDALDLSSGNPNDMSAASCNETTQLEQTAGAEEQVVASATTVETTALIHTPNQREAFSPVQAEGDLQR